MKYLIVPKDDEPFLTNWFDVENNYVKGWIVFDLDDFSYYDGIDWKELQQDHL